MMKKYVKFALVVPALAGLFLLASVPNFSTKANGENFYFMTEDEITIDKTTHDFETIYENEGKVSATFVLTNNTQKPVIITDVRPDCGCTSPEWTKEPIAPGKTGNVVATYDAKNKKGAFNKGVTISTNGNPRTFRVFIKGTVELAPPTESK